MEGIFILEKWFGQIEYEGSMGRQVLGKIYVLRMASDPLVKEMNADGTFSIVPMFFYKLATMNTIATVTLVLYQFNPQI